MHALPRHTVWGYVCARGLYIVLLCGFCPLAPYSRGAHWQGNFNRSVLRQWVQNLHPAASRRDFDHEGMLSRPRAVHE